MSVDWASGYFYCSDFLWVAARHDGLRRQKRPPTSATLFGKKIDDSVAVAYRSWMLNQTLAKDLVATLSLGVADCGHKPNIPLVHQVIMWTNLLLGLVNFILILKYIPLSVYPLHATLPYFLFF
jgi:hypothetical protein